MKIEINNKKYTLKFYFDRRLYNTVIFQQEKDIIKEIEKQVELYNCSTKN